MAAIEFRLDVRLTDWIAAFAKSAAAVRSLFDRPSCSFHVSVASFADIPSRCVTPLFSNAKSFVSISSGKPHNGWASSAIISSCAVSPLRGEAAARSTPPASRLSIMNCAASESRDPFPMDFVATLPILGAAVFQAPYSSASDEKKFCCTQSRSDSCCTDSLFSPPNWSFHSPPGTERMLSTSKKTGRSGTTTFESSP